MDSYEIPGEAHRGAAIGRSLRGAELADVVTKAAAFKEPTVIAEGDSVFVASDASEDREGDVIALDWNLANFRRNPVILADHCRRDVIGKAAAAWVTDTALMIVVTWHDDAEVNPNGALIAAQHRNGFRAAGSVGFSPGRVTPRHNLPSDHEAYRKPKDGESPWFPPSLYEKCELLEFSSVSIPANARALQQRGTGGAEALFKSLADVEKWLNDKLPAIIREQVDANSAAAIIRAIRSDADVRRAVAVAASATPAAHSPDFSAALTAANTMLRNALQELR